ncbi:MAG: peptide chain release factor-like protein [Nibricoccus sp.]
MNLPTQIQTRLDNLGVLASDVEEKFIRGSGAGGQKINKTSSTVWLRHRPSGVEVRIQQERSQAANRELAWEELCAKLESVLRQAEAERRSKIERERRRKRPKSYAQKQRMIASKRHRRGLKDNRGRVASGD